MKLEKYFLLNWKKVGIIIIAWIVAVLLHNGIYALFYEYYSKTGGDEAVFFIIAVFIIPLYFVISLIYTIFYHVKRSVKAKRVSKTWIFWLILIIILVIMLVFYILSETTGIININLAWFGGS